MTSIESPDRLGRATAGRPPRVAVVILNWKRPDLTAACLASLRRSDYSEWFAIVVDNGSGDDSIALIRERFPDALVVDNGVNLGFAAGNNPGIAQAIRSGADYVLLLNDDTEVAPEMLRILVEEAESDPRIGIVGPKILYYQPANVIWSAGGAVSKLGVPGHLRADEADDDANGTSFRTDYVTGCAMLVRRSVIERVGGFDERFFMYFEETEWCARARRAGYEVRCAPSARMWHKIPPGARGASPTYQYLMTRNRLLYLRCAGVSPWTLGIACLSVIRTAVSWSVRPRHRAMRPFARVLVRGLADFLRERYGAPPPFI